jgi:YidC/Oxa1 family membrane protein insertase
VGLLNPLYNAVSWVLLRFHDLFSLVLNPDSGWTWALSIVGLVVLIRILLIPLFVKQIKAQRGLQALQPKMKEIQKKHANDREKQSQELMKLYKDTGTNPLASCLPIVVQAPFFFSLFHVLSYVAKDKPVGVITDPQTISSFANATIFGAKISDTFTHADTTSTRIVTLVLIILMTATTFITQRQLMLKNVVAGQDNPMAQQQKILLYVFPFMFAVFGINFPIGVLIYWLTTNLWTMGQQFWVIHRNPAPGSPAYDDMLKRRAAKEAHKKAAEARRNIVSGDVSGDGAGDSGVQTVVNDVPTAPQRQQPKRQPKSKRGGTPKR